MKKVTQELEVVHVRLPTNVVREVDHLRVDLHVTRQHLIGLLLREALDARKTEEK